MDKTICGHERDVLRQACSIIIEDLVTGCSALTADSGCKTCMAILDLNDPAKIAEMLVEVGRRLGFDARCCDGFGIPKHRGEMTVIWHDDCQVVEVWCHRWHTFTMPTARDVLAAWIRLPEGLTEEAKQVLAQYNQQTRRP